MFGRITRIKPCPFISRLGLKICDRQLHGMIIQIEIIPTYVLCSQGTAIGVPDQETKHIWMYYQSDWSWMPDAWSWIESVVIPDKYSVSRNPSPVSRLNQLQFLFYANREMGYESISLRAILFCWMMISCVQNSTSHRFFLRGFFGKLIVITLIHYNTKRCSKLNISQKK